MAALSGWLTPAAAATTIITDASGDTASVSGPVSDPRVDLLSVDLDDDADSLTVVFTVDDLDAGPPSSGPSTALAYSYLTYTLDLKVDGHDYTARAAIDDDGTAFRLIGLTPDEHFACEQDVTGSFDSAADTVTVDVPFSAFSACGQTVGSGSVLSSFDAWLVDSSSKVGLTVGGVTTIEDTAVGAGTYTI